MEEDQNHLAVAELEELEDSFIDVGDSSSSASSTAASSVSFPIKWVTPQSLGTKFTADLWNTDLFQVSFRPLQNGKRKIKCLECKSNEQWGSGNVSLDGTSAPAHHAESVHSKLAKVDSWIQRKNEKKEQSLGAKRTANEALKSVF